MEKLKNLCGQIPEELHNKVRTEQESLGLSQRDFVLGLIEQEVSGWENQQAVEQDAVIPQEETDEALSNVGVVQQISEDEPLTEDLEEESSGFSMVMM